MDKYYVNVKIGNFIAINWYFYVDYRQKAIKIYIQIFAV